MFNVYHPPLFERSSLFSSQGRCRQTDWQTDTQTDRRKELGCARTRSSQVRLGDRAACMPPIGKRHKEEEVWCASTGFSSADSTSACRYGKSLQFGKSNIIFLPSNIAIVNFHFYNFLKHCNLLFSFEITFLRIPISPCWEECMAKLFVYF